MDKLKLSFIKDATHVDIQKKNGVVVVKLLGFVRGFGNFIDANCIVGTGVAHLKKGDKFNEDLGVKIATAKAESKAYKKALKLVKTEIEKQKKELFRHLDFVGRAEGIIEHNKKYIHKIGGTVD